MKRHAFLLLGVLFVLWVGCGFGDEISPAENMIQAAALPTRAVGSIAAIGDSITAAFNAAHSEFESCEYRDTPAYNFATNKVRNTTVSIAERAIAYKGDGVAIANFGQDGARMSHGDDQAQAAKTWLMKQATPRLVTVFLGHNDICSGTKDKFTSCESTNRDPVNYCRTSKAYEQQMRQMLDVTIPDSQIPAHPPHQGLATLQLQGRKGHRCTMDFKKLRRPVGCTHGHLPPGWCMSVTEDRLHGRPHR